MAASKPIYVTRPELPPLEEFMPYLQKIWDTRVLSNSGPFHQMLEASLCEYLGVKHICLFTNATIALVTALQSLRVTGEVITTPYSFVATAHSLVWNGIKPVFVDIDPVTLNIDASKIEAAITPQTTAILPIHCYGTPCDVDAIARVADDYNLKVIYDAAHAFGVRRSEGGEMRSILNHGDLSVVSFHATKVFNTFEGGAIICPDLKTKQRIDHLKNFGFVNETTVVATGINGKMSEFNAALGLVQLKHIDDAIARRHAVAARYRTLLAGVPGVQLLDVPADAMPNDSYFPILVDERHALGRDGLYRMLRDEGVVARRYFHPLITDFPMYRGYPSADPAGLTVARSAADRVLCLPIYPSLAAADVDRIAGFVRDTAVAAVEEPMLLAA